MALENYLINSPISLISDVTKPLAAIGGQKVELQNLSKIVITGESAQKMNSLKVRVSWKGLRLKIETAEKMTFKLVVK